MFFAHKHFINLLISALSILHFFSNLVAEDFVPVDLGAGDGQLPAQGFESGVRHGLVVLADRCLQWQGASVTAVIRHSRKCEVALKPQNPFSKAKAH